MALLTVSNISKTYPGSKIPALSGVGFEIAKGEIVGMVGLNGAGKTTCFKILAAMMYPDAGNVLSDGKDIFYKPHKSRRNIGYLPEGNPLWPESTPLNYLNLRASFLGLQNKKKSVDEMLDLTGLSGVRRLPVSAMSSGYRQRLGLAATFLGWPELLLLDEPSRGLDFIQIETLHELIKTASGKSTILISSHGFDELERLAERFLILKNGKLIFDGKIPSDKTLRDYFSEFHKD